MSALIEGLSTTDALAAVFDDGRVLQAMLDVEVAIARAEARLGLIPDAAAAAIATASVANRFDPAAIARDARESGTVAIPLVKALTAAVAQQSAESAKYVHWGVTSQDIVDTGLVLVIRDAGRIVAADHARVLATLRALSDRHAATVMLGRTLLQPAPPVTFGLTAARWFSGVARAGSAVANAARAAAALQLGGASGTRAALAEHGGDVSRLVAAELDLADPPAPWHTERDRTAALGAAHGVYTAMLGKVARDITLLMQHGIEEVLEPGGGSSAMPQKRNPSGSAIVLAAAVRVPGLVASLLTAAIQEHERGPGGWHAEWPILADIVRTSGAAVASMAGVLAGLTVDADRMRANIAATRGAVFAERAMMLLAPAIGRAAAHDLVAEAARESRRSGRTLGEILASRPQLSAVGDRGVWAGLDDPAAYLGEAETMRQRLLSTS
jgi:3-carboxy-cis,cis-muconate cycloisomerase